MKLYNVLRSVSWGLAAFVMTGLPAFAEVNSGSILDAEDLNYLATKGELVVVMQQNNEPFEFEREGELRGINVDLIRWMEKEMGLKVRIESASLIQAQEMLRHGEADIISSMFISDLIDPEVDFSDNIKTSLINLYVRSESAGVKRITDLDGRRVAVLQSGFAGRVLRDADVGCDICYVSSTEECVDLLVSGRVDAMVGNDLITQHYLYSSERKDVRVAGTPFAAGRMCLAIRDSEDALLRILNKGILAAKQSGTLLEIETEWLGFGNEKQGLPLKAILSVVGVGGLLILLVILWNVSLRNKVAEKTRQFSASEKRLREVFENSPEVILLVERDGTLLLANHKATSMFRMSMDTLLSQRAVDLFPNAYPNEIAANPEKWFSGELCVCESELQFPDGEAMVIELTGKVVQVDSRAVLQLHVHDITVRHEAEEKMEAACEMAEKSHALADRACEIAENASQVKSEFLAHLSRDIRTPLNDIIGMGQLLSDNPGESERTNCLSIIQDSSDGLIKTIDNVLEIAKLESGRMKVLVNNFDIHALFSQVQERFQKTADAASIQFDYQCGPKVPRYLVGDSGLLDQVLSYLVDDAIKYTSHGTVSLSVECLAKSPDGAELSIKVTDTGVGISKEKQAMIFEAPDSLGGPLEHYQSGRGLGLAVCKRQVELMGGSIGVDSEDGLGATVYFSLCLPQANGTGTVAAPENLKENISLKPGTSVLLVEDNKVNQKVVSRMLTTAGCTVETADNGRDAVLFLHRNACDVVLMDCLMPVMDGFEATRKIRSMSGPIAFIPIIAITANAMKEDQQACLECGMNDYITKPINRALLSRKINKYVAHDGSTNAASSETDIS